MEKQIITIHLTTVGGMIELKNKYNKRITEEENSIVFNQDEIEMEYRKSFLKGENNEYCREIFEYLKSNVNSITKEEIKNYNLKDDLPNFIESFRNIVKDNGNSITTSLKKIYHPIEEEINKIWAINNSSLFKKFLELQNPNKNIEIILSPKNAETEENIQNFIDNIEERIYNRELIFELNLDNCNLENNLTRAYNNNTNFKNLNLQEACDRLIKQSKNILKLGTVKLRKKTYKIIDEHKLKELKDYVENLEEESKKLFIKNDPNEKLSNYAKSIKINEELKKNSRPIFAASNELTSNVQIGKF